MYFKYWFFTAACWKICFAPWCMTETYRPAKCTHEIERGHYYHHHHHHHHHHFLFLLHFHHVLEGLITETQSTFCLKKMCLAMQVYPPSSMGVPWCHDGSRCSVRYEYLPLNSRFFTMFHHFFHYFLLCFFPLLFSMLLKTGVNFWTFGGDKLGLVLYSNSNFRV